MVPVAPLSYGPEVIDLSVPPCPLEPLGMSPHLCSGSQGRCWRTQKAMASHDSPLWPISILQGPPAFSKGSTGRKSQRQVSKELLIPLCLTFFLFSSGVQNTRKLCKVRLVWVYFEGDVLHLDFSDGYKILHLSKLKTAPKRMNLTICKFRNKFF